MVTGDEKYPVNNADDEDEDDNVINFSLCLDENDFDFDSIPNLPQLDGADDFDESILDFSVAKVNIVYLSL